MKYLLLIALSTQLFSQTIHSSFSTYYEDKTFKNSKQKNDGIAYGVGVDIHIDKSAYRATYEYGKTDTKKPPLTKDLEVKKLFLRYQYEVNNALALNVNHLNILNDNIAITDDGESYGLGLTYKPSKKITTNFTQFYTDYEDFNVNQSDLTFIYKTKIESLKIKINYVTKYINIDEKIVNAFTKNAQREYLTNGVKLHMHYGSYHFGSAAYLGKRAFAIMNDGFKIQHHAMEFDRTYAVGFGKSISNFVVRLQYTYQRATELPMSHKDVEVEVMKVVANYKF